MGNEKKYEITESELKAYICLAAIRSESEEIPVEKAIERIETAAEIFNEIQQHLDGTKPFSQEELKEYDMAEKASKVVFGIWEEIDRERVRATKIR